MAMPDKHVDREDAGEQSHRLREAAYRQALDAHCIVSITDRRGVITYANDLFCAISGYSREELVGATHALLNSGEHGRAFFQDMWRTIASGRTWTGEIRNRAKSGSHYWVHTDIIPLVQGDGTIEGYVSVRRDITARKRTEKALQRNEAFLRSVTEVSGVGGWSYDMGTGELYWSRHTKLIHEVPSDFRPDVEKAIAFYAPEARETIREAVESSLQTGEPWDLELPLITAKGNSLWVRAVGQPTFEQGKVSGLIGAIQDVTQRRLAEDVLRDEVAHRHETEQLLRDVLETIPDAVSAFDKDDRLIICNTSYIETYAASREAIRPGATFESIVRCGLARGQYADVGDDPREQEAWLARRLSEHRNPSGPTIQKLRDGTWLQIREHRSESGATVGLRSDITSIKRAEAELRRFAEEDALTGLMNRARFSLDLKRLLARTRRSPAPGHSCVALFDLDHFKTINDSHGHDIGDEVLQEVARRLRLVLGPGDLAARLGGDEFVFVLHGYGSQAQCAARIMALFQAFEAPIQTSGPALPVTLSLGVTPIDEATLDGARLLKQADQAQYRAKERGRAQWCWFDAEDRATMEREARLAQKLREDLEAERGLSFPLMPILDPASGVPVGFSGEMRWEHDGAVFETGQLRPLAQKARLAEALCSRKLQTLLGQIGTLESRGIGCGTLWVSINADQLRLPRLAEGLDSLRARHGLSASSLMVGVDEAALGGRSASAVEGTLRMLKDKGMGIAVDGFGSAGLPLSRLRSLRVDAVRIDLDSLAGEGRKGHDPALVLAAVEAARALDLAVHIAGVRDADCPNALAKLGCAGIQGPAVAPAVTGEAVTDFLSRCASRRLAGLAARMGAPALGEGGAPALRQRDNA